MDFQQSRLDQARPYADCRSLDTEVSHPVVTQDRRAEIVYVAATAASLLLQSSDFDRWFFTQVSNEIAIAGSRLESTTEVNFLSEVLEVGEEVVGRDHLCALVRAFSP